MEPPRLKNNLILTMTKQFSPNSIGTKQWGWPNIFWSIVEKSIGNFRPKRDGALILGTNLFIS